MRHSIGVGVAGLMLPEARLTYDPVGRIAMRSSRRGNSTRGRLGCSTRSGRRQTRRAVRCRYQTLQAENRLSHRCWHGRVARKKIENLCQTRVVLPKTPVVRVPVRQREPCRFCFGSERAASGVCSQERSTVGLRTRSGAASSASFACGRRYSPSSSLQWLNPALRSIQQPNNQITK